MRQLYSEAVNLLEAGESFVQATILKSSGSVPRRAGASMLCLKNGSIRGTVGGGALEAGIIRAAPGVFESKQKCIIDMVLDGNDAVATGMICGGSASVQLEYIDADDLGNLARFKQQQSELFYGTGGTAYIFGAGHCGEKLVPVLHSIGFSVVIIDDREEFANTMRFPEADEVLVPKTLDLPFADIVMGEHSYIIIVTRGHAHDELVLRQALNTNAGYIGMIGSKAKRNSIYSNLLKDGYTQADLDRVYSPIGISIGAETPEEIAISIAAELIKVRVNRQGSAV